MRVAKVNATYFLGVKEIFSLWDAFAQSEGLRLGYMGLTGYSPMGPPTTWPQPEILSLDRILGPIQNLLPAPMFQCRAVHRLHLNRYGI